MSLSSEDSLRLNVLLANAVAIRIDEGAMVVHGLSRAGDEARIQLNPNCRPEQYVRHVRELLSSNVLGSPGGYPVYLKRWTRMGQAGANRLADLLMLGEPEAVVAVSGAPGLTDDLARCAWWAMPDSENARRMLCCDAVASGSMGPVLAEFLVEFLPFEQEPQAIIDSVRLIVQHGLIDDEARAALWERGRAKSVFRIGFLQAQPDDLPGQAEARGDLPEHHAALQELSSAGNPWAHQLLRVLSGPGQRFIQACEAAARRPSNQDSVCALLDAVGDYFARARVAPGSFERIDDILGVVEAAKEGGQAPAVRELLAAVPQLDAEVRAMLVLAHVGEPVVRPIFARTDAVGSVMRRKLEPVMKPVVQQFNVLQAKAG